MAATFAMSAGILLSTLQSILQQQYGLSQIDAIRSLFTAYSILGLISAAIYFMLSKKIELTSRELVKPLTQTLSPHTRMIVGKLSGLFTVDSLVGGFVIQSIVSFWFFLKSSVDL